MQEDRDDGFDFGGSRVNGGSYMDMRKETTDKHR
jgi:hypothetical protein